VFPLTPLIGSVALWEPGLDRDPQFDSLSIRVLGDTRFFKGVNLGVAVLGLGGLVEHEHDYERRTMDFKLPLRGEPVRPS
jgi:hypothetical protein